MTISESESEIPLEYSLGQNYPNPFNPSSTLSYDLPEASDINLVVFDMLGRVVESSVIGQAHRSLGRQRPPKWGLLLSNRSRGFRANEKNDLDEAVGVTCRVRGSTFPGND